VKLTKKLLDNVFFNDDIIDEILQNQEKASDYNKMNGIIVDLMARLKKCEENNGQMG